jgi:DNA-binding response OmpR family regulator
MKKVILVGEKNPSLRGTMLRRLSVLGFEAYGAADGLSCLAAARDLHPHAIIVDVDMPWGGDGVIDGLRGYRTSAMNALILATGAADRDVTAAQTGLPPDRCFTKPFRLSSLILSLIEKLDESWTQMRR